MPSAEMLSQVDPNLIYLGLIASLWAVVTIVYTPGTIFGELLSAALTLVTLAVLVNQPTNWVAVLLVVIGVSGFLALPFMSLKYARFADLGLILQALGGFFLFNGKSVSLGTIFVTILIAWVYHRGVLMPALRFHASAVNGDEKSRVVGLLGRVTRQIDPVGTVYVGGEMWTARSDEPIMQDVEIIVTDKVGLELRVEKAKRSEA